MTTVTVRRDEHGAVIIEQHPARIVITDPNELQRVAHAILDYALDAEYAAEDTERLLRRIDRERNEGNGV